MSDVTYADEPGLKKTWIYAIGVATTPKGPVKIGRTTKTVEQRLRDIQRGGTLIVPKNINREALRVLYATATEPWIESRLHQHFNRFHLCGEWFALNPAVVAREVRLAVSEILRREGHEDLQPEEWAAPEIQPDTAAAVAMSPKQHLRLFNGWVDVGFSEEQALRMVAMLVSENR